MALQAIRLAKFPTSLAKVGQSGRLAIWCESHPLSPLSLSLSPSHPGSLPARHIHPPSAVAVVLPATTTRSPSGSAVTVVRSEMAQPIVFPRPSGIWSGAATTTTSRPSACTTPSPSTHSAPPTSRRWR
uniref:Uncharacterized protein n=1 Tax=Oryza sativa subsp. japonica TaxID=39947 RepID=Q6EQ19_ORYSJ|nr:hypothetical protein [Oryza sativa Japonica Group]BAD29251.1 hypothetical protein [Oryza sativa Japonica Group]